MSADPSPLVLVVDVGTSSVRGALYDARAQRLEATAAHEPHAMVGGPDGAAEAPADDVAACVERVVDAVLAASGGAAGRIAAVGLDTLAATLVGVEASGRPATPIYTYADSRSPEDALALRGDMDDEAVLQRTGCPLHTAYWPARLRWLRLTSASSRPVAREPTPATPDTRAVEYGRRSFQTPCNPPPRCSVPKD
jgi:gluconokinase